MKSVLQCSCAHGSLSRVIFSQVIANDKTFEMWGDGEQTRSFLYAG